MCAFSKRRSEKQKCNFVKKKENKRKAGYLERENRKKSKHKKKIAESLWKNNI